MRRQPIIGVTMGDPKGIGPEVIQKAFASPQIKDICHPLLFGDSLYFNWKKSKKLPPKDAGRLSGFYIEQAVHAVMTQQIEAIVTGPISKEHFQLAGYPFPGHTEFLASLSKTKKFRMMMAGHELRVVLATIHEPLSKVPSLLSKKIILETIQLTAKHLHDWFGIRKPRIAVAALNPHAGEGGLFGDEEKKKIEPAIREAQAQGINATGPLSPDTVFYRTVQGEFDAVVVMYHDQGLIPFKLLHFKDGVNLTLGLPFIRTSVDHGTGFDIAGKGKADPESMICAIELAVCLSQKRKK